MYTSGKTNVNNWKNGSATQGKTHTLLCSSQIADTSVQGGEEKEYIDREEREGEEEEEQEEEYKDEEGEEDERRRTEYILNPSSEKFVSIFQQDRVARV